MSQHLTEDQLYLIIGRRIREARTKVGLSQTVLAKRVDLVRTSLTNIEAGEQKLPVHTLYKIAEELGVSIRDLLPDTEEAPVDFQSLLNQKVVVAESGKIGSLDENEKAKILQMIRPNRREENDREG